MTTTTPTRLRPAAPSRTPGRSPGRPPGRTSGGGADRAPGRGPNRPAGRAPERAAPTGRNVGTAVRSRIAVGRAGTGTDSRPTTTTVRQPAGRRSRSFVALFALVAVLNAIGLTMILSASAATEMAESGSPWGRFIRQAAWLGVAMVALVLSLRTDYRKWQRWARPLMMVSLVMLALVLVPGIGKLVNGARRWIGVGPVQIQPSEVAKLAMLLFVADLLARRSHRMGDTRLTMRPALVVFGAVAVLVLKQPNLGTTVLIFVILFVMLYVAGTPGWALALLAGAGVGLALLLAVFAPYRMARLASFSDPFENPYTTGYQGVQSQLALSNGDLTGTGVGQGRGKFGYLPEADTDFIFSVVGEETGFLGSCLVIGLFLAWGAIALKVALHAPDRFGMLVASGIAVWVLFQAFVNIGVAVGILPNTGVPLPFLSAGGSSLLVTMIASGILLNISRHTP